MKKNLILFLQGIVIGGFLAFSLNFFQLKIDDFLFAQLTKSLQEHTVLTLEEFNISKRQINQNPPIQLDVKAAMSLRVNPKKKEPEKILVAKNENEILPIASLTKLMTALIVLENPKEYDLSKTVIISETAAQQKNTPYYGNLDKEVGKKFTVEKLLELMLIYSSNDAAWALSEILGTEKFVEKMNQKAKELSLENTYFVNPHGLDPENGEFKEHSEYFNRSSAKDLIKLSQYILQNHPLIFEITKQKPIQPLENGISDLVLTQELIGGKTGFTKNAGGCLIILFKTPEDDVFINVILGALSEKDRIKEMQKLIDWIESKIVPTNPTLLTWKKVEKKIPWSPRDSHGVVVYQDKIWLMGGLNGNGFVITPGKVKYYKAPHFSDIWVSEDGVNWNLVTDKAPWGKRRSIQSVVFKNKLWILPGWGPQTGLKSEIWYSDDGINWNRVSGNWPPREGTQLVVFRDKLWILGGVDYDKREVKNDIWCSEDGINWYEVTSSALWAPRWDHKVIVFKEKLWLVGGMDLKNNVFGDIWVSENGKEWKLVTDHPPWKKRQGHEMVVFQHKLWLIGRFNEPNEKEREENDVWFSEDGIHWEKTKYSPPWLGREDFGTVVFRNKIWIFGGMTIDWNWQNDIWYSAFSNY